MNEFNERATVALLEAATDAAPSDLAGRILDRLDLAHRWIRVEGPVGATFVARFRGRITALLLSDAAGTDGFEEWMLRRFGTVCVADPEPDPVVVRELTDALTRGRTDLDVDLSSCTPFQREVLAQALSIPRGEVRTYGDIARSIGRPKATRAVGTALGRNPVPLLVPCHRVVPAGGGVGNYAFGADRKAKLLRLEGAVVA